MKEAIAPVSDWFHANIDAAVLAVLLLFTVWIVFKAQQRNDFDWAKMLKDESGKESALNLGIFGSFAVSTWIVMHDTLAKELSDQQFWAYLITWSGARILVLAAQKWDGRLPWAKPQ